MPPRLVLGQRDDRAEPAASHAVLTAVVRRVSRSVLTAPRLDISRRFWYNCSTVGLRPARFLPSGSAP